ncbi:McrC family protein [Siphonobacter sp. BAB-5405]|uniref:McrC family protein n=1 Tax=Siphonobacter sp. BAB-5405 TaxID=1864825 RepID=UPI0013049376|nr:hypothetical protein [Siphonobacter sp. BAB-5405]
MRQPFLSFEYVGPNVGPRIKAGRYVGFIQFQGLTIEIIPKLFNVEQAGRAFQHVLWWLSYAQSFTFPFAELSSDSDSIEDLPEAFFQYFAYTTENLIQQQPYHQYESVTESMPYLRGRLDTAGYIRSSLSQGHWHELVCEHEPFVFNNRLNQIIKFVTRKLLGLSRRLPTRQILERLLFHLDEVADVPISRADCDRIILHRFYEGYEHCLDLCRFFLSDRYSNQTASEEQQFCFLVPMDRVFEEFVTGVMKEKLGSMFRSIDLQKAGKLTQEGVFTIKNDALLTTHTGDVIVVDTKYKVRSVGVDAKAGISQTDLYQMISYALRRGSRRVFLLYPSLPKMTSSSHTFTVAASTFTQEPMVITAKDVEVTGLRKQEILDGLEQELFELLVT